MDARPDLHQLAEHPDLYRAVFEGLGHGVVVLSLDGFIVDANEAHLDQIGRLREELVGQFSPVYTHPEDLEAIVPLMIDLITGARAEVRARYRFVHGDGETKRCGITARRIDLPSGEQVVAIAYDREDDAEGVLEQELGDPDSSPLHLFFGRGTYTVNDLDGTLANVAKATAALLGRTTAELTGLRWSSPELEPVFSDGRPLTDADDPVLVAAAHGEGSIDVVGFRRPDGTRAWVSMQCALAPFRGGKSVITSLTDVTDIARAHEERSRLASIVEVTDDLVASFDLVGRCRWLNRSAERALGRGADELSIADVTTTEVRSTLATEVLDALRTDGRWTGDLDLTVDGRVLALAANVIAEHDEDRALIGWTLVGHDLTARKALEAELAHRATHDDLTGIANRALLFERLDEAEATGAAITIVFVDLHGFKAINDSHGHRVGDQALVEVARRLAAVVGDHGFVARYGGDEFVVLPDPAWLDPVGAVSRAFVEPMAVGDLRLDVRAGVGLATGAPGDPAADVLGRADLAMYEAKSLRTTD